MPTSHAVVRSLRILPLLLLLGLLATRGTAQESAPTDTLQTAPADTGTVAAPDDPVWLDLGQADPDSVLLSGGGVLLAFEDTFTFDPGEIDTLDVAAKRVTIGEVIEAVGRRMDAEAANMRNVEFTTLTTVVERDVPSRYGQDYKVTEVAERSSFDDNEGMRAVQLWERIRTVEGGEVVEEEVSYEKERDWGDVGASIGMAMPFSPRSGNRYNYVIEGRHLVGNGLIYRIGFTPKSRFEALPSGTVWVDYSHWVIRALEAELVETVPFPMFLKAVPVFRISRARFGGYWFTTDVHLVIELRKIPLVNMPRVVEVRTRIRDIEINGQPVTADMTVPEADRFGNLDPDEFWYSPAASDDSLRAFWQQVDAVWEQDQTDALAPVALTEAQIDSLTIEGRKEIEQMWAASPWAMHWIEPRIPGFNRAQGLILRAGAKVWHRGPERPEFKFMAGYAFSNKRPEFKVEVDWPLVRGRSGNTPALGSRPAPLGLDVAGWKEGRYFAGDNRRVARSFTAFTYGSDPNQWFESRGASARLTWRPARRLSLWGEGVYAEERTMAQRTSWNLLGRSLRPDGNAPVHDLDDNRLGTGLWWRYGVLRLDGSLVWHSSTSRAYDTEGAKRDLQRYEVGGKIDWLDGMGNQWLLKGRHREFDGMAPRQWRVWLGDLGTLRGYPAAELTGDAGTWASLDLRLGWDLFRATHLPGLKNWGIQTLGFVDWGQTRQKAGPWPEEGTTGERWDVGFGFGRRLDLPFTWGYPYLRTYIAKPVGEGSEGRGWRFLIAFEK